MTLSRTLTIWTVSFLVAGWLLMRVGIPLAPLLLGGILTLGVTGIRFIRTRRMSGAGKH